MSSLLNPIFEYLGGIKILVNPDMFFRDSSNNEWRETPRCFFPAYFSPSCPHYLNALTRRVVLVRFALSRLASFLLLQILLTKKCKQRSKLNCGSYKPFSFVRFSGTKKNHECAGGPWVRMEIINIFNNVNEAF